MKKLIIKFIVFMIPIYLVMNLYFKYSTKVMVKKYGPNTEQQIDFSFMQALERDYDCLILGNSRIYRGINPEILEIKTYNFAHDNDAFNQVYYKIKYLEDHNKEYKYLILGIDYFEFSFLSDTRNYAYKKYFSKEYLEDFNYFDKIASLLDDEKFKNKIFRKITMTINPVIDNLLERKRDYTSNYLKENGQYIVLGEKAKAADTVERKSEILQIQLNYFNKILDYAKKNNIEVFLVMPPVRKNELKSYSEDTITKYDELFKNEAKDSGVYYLNYSLSPGFKLEDYMDITHLNQKGSDKFTKMLNSDIIKLLKNSMKF